MKFIAFPVWCSCYVLGFIKCYNSLFNLYTFCLIYPVSPSLFTLNGGLLVDFKLLLVDFGGGGL